MRVLVVNAGSSSLKLSLVGPEGTLLQNFDTLPRALASSPEAVGHRVVHGGDRVQPTVLDDRVVQELRDLTGLAPLHQPPALDLVDQLRQSLPDVPHVACFDTAFHTTMSPAASTYALPAGWRERWGLRRYGFHGLSHAWAARRAAELGCGPRVVVAHLGSGASLCAVRDGRSVDTTMGFTPLEGLVMHTRSGSVDPGLVLWLLDQGMSIAEVRDGLEREAGLLGLGGTTDLDVLLARADQTPVEVYVHRLRAQVAAMAAALGGLDALVFTGGVGEHQPEIRRRCVEGLQFLCLQIDGSINPSQRGDGDVSPAGAAARVLVVHAREDAEVARGVHRALSG